MTENISKIGSKIRQLRKQKGLSQRELADGVCSESTISQLENGNYPSMPSGTILSGLCAKLDLTLGELLDEVGVDRGTIETDVMLDLIKVQIHRREFEQAQELLEELQGRAALLKYQQYDWTICQADCLTKTGRYQEAIELLTGLQRELEEERVGDDHLLATVFNKLGSAWYLAANMLHAYSSYQRAYQISLRFAEPDLLSAHITYNLGNVSRWLRRDMEALAFLQTAKELYEKVSDSRNLADTLFELGIVHRNVNQWEQAAVYLQDSLALYRSLEVSEMVRITKHQYAFYILSVQDPDRAIAELRELAEQFADDGELTHAAYNHARTASVLLDNDRLVEAGEHLERAMELLPEDEPQDIRHAYLYRIYSRYLLCLKKFEECYKYARKACDMFEAMGLKKEMADSLELVAQGYEEEGKMAEGHEMLKQIIELLKGSLVQHVLT